jgi:hypothetical protein
MDIAQAVTKGRPSRRLARQLAVDGKWVELVKRLGNCPRVRGAFNFQGSPEGLVRLNEAILAWASANPSNINASDVDRVVAELTLLAVAGYRLGWCPDGHPFAYPPRGRKAEACPKHTARYRKLRWRENKKAWRVPAKLPPQAAKQPPT